MSFKVQNFNYMKTQTKTKILIIILGIFIFFYILHIKKEANYKYVGQFHYKIENEEIFNNTTLSSLSYGISIGDLVNPGISIKGIKSLDKNKDYIISLNYPIEHAFINSSKIYGEAQTHIKKNPIDIVQNKSIKKDLIFIYELNPKDKYRLLLP